MEPEEQHPDLPSMFRSRHPTFQRRVNERIFSMFIMPGNRMVIGGDPSGNMDVMHPETGEVEFTMGDVKEKGLGHLDSVLVMAAQDEYLYTASADKTVKMWSLRSLKCVKTFEGHAGMVSCLAVRSHSAGSGLFSGGDDNLVKQWNWISGRCLCSFRGHKFPITSVMVTETTLFSGDADGTVKVWEILRREAQMTIDAHKGTIWTMALSESNVLLTGGDDGLIKLWPDPGKEDYCSSVLTGHHGPVKCLLLHGDTLFSCGRDSLVAVWDLYKGELKEILRPVDPVGKACKHSLVALGLHNNELTAAGFDKVINRWDVTNLLDQKQTVVPFQDLQILEDKRELEEDRKLTVKQRHQKYLAMEVWEAMYRFQELPLNHVIDSLNFKVEAAWLQSELLIFIPFLIMFLFFFLSEYSSFNAFVTTKALVDNIEGNEIAEFKLQRWFENINEIARLQIWTTSILFAGIFGGKSATSWFQPVRVAGQNQLIGAVRYRIHRSKPNSCGLNKNLVREDYRSHPGFLRCYGPGWVDDNLDKEPFACDQGQCVWDPTALQSAFNFTSRKFEFKDGAGTFFNGRAGVYADGGYVVDFPGILSAAEASRRANLMFEQGFIDTKATRLVMVEYFTYNPAFDMFMSTKHTIEIPPGGGWVSITYRRPFKIWSMRLSTGKLVYELFFFCFVMFWVVNFFIEMRKYKKMYGKVGTFLLDSWNIMEVSNVSIFIIMYGFRWSWFNVSEETNLVMPFDNTKFPEELERMTDAYLFQVYLNAINTVLTFLKILKYVRLNDKLNILTRTLAAAQQNIVGCLALFVYIVFAFSLMGWSLYGTLIWEWRSIDAAYNTLMRSLVGDFDYQPMSLVSREWTFVFFWAFIILGMFILLNFLIAVLSDAFNEVHAQRMPVTLDASIQKVTADVSSSCLPKQLRTTFMLMAQRRTRTSVTASYAAQLRKQRAAMLPVDAQDSYYLVENQYVDKTDFLRCAPPEIRTEKNINFMDEVWLDMAFEYYWKLQDIESLEKHEMETTVFDTIEEVINPLKEKIGVEADDPELRAQSLKELTKRVREMHLKIFHTDAVDILSRR